MKEPGSTHPRNDPRIYVGLPVEMKFGWKGCESLSASVVDISEQGLRVRCPSPLRLGLEVEVVFEKDAENAKTYRVVWVRDAQTTPHAFEIGLTLKL